LETIVEEGDGVGVEAGFMGEKGGEGGSLGGKRGRGWNDKFSFV
jgi:hypothetical protein